MEQEKKRIRLTTDAQKNAILFAGIIIVYCFWLVRAYGYMSSRSGDANSIWNCIATWDTAETQYSYVLYKGIFALYPYLWFYRLETLLGLPGQSLCIVFFAILYAYSAVYGFPAVAKYLVGQDKPVSTWKRLLFAAVLFVITEYSFIYSELMVDLPSMAFYLMMIHLAILLPKQDKKMSFRAQKYAHFLVLGLCTGVCFGFSGQYSLATGCIVIFVLEKVSKEFQTTRRNERLQVWLRISAYASGILFIVWLNQRFLNSVVGSAVENGAFIPTGEWWMERSLYRSLQYYQYWIQYIPAPRTMQIANRLYGEAEAVKRFMDIDNNMEYAFWSTVTYLKTAFRYLVDFLTVWLNHFFKAISMDQYHQCVSSLSVCYIALYTSLYTLVKRVKRWGDIFNKNAWIVLGFLCTAIPLMVMTIEPRCAVIMVGFFLSFMICGNELWDGIAEAMKWLKNAIEEKKSGAFREARFPKAFAAGVIFFIMCFAWYAALMENCGTGTDILFHL